MYKSSDMSPQISVLKYESSEMSARLSPQISVLNIIEF